MSGFDYDLFVIGGGSGGVRAARIASGHGAKVAVAEEYRIGGTCVIRGCVPKKLLVYASRFADDFEDASGFGWTLAHPTFDWARLIANKDSEITRLEGLYKAGLDRAKVETFRERATVAGPTSVRLQGSGRTVSARNILIAVGGAPFKLDIPGAELAITSNEAFHLAALPTSILVVGGGYIAVEFASIFNGLGVSTTLAYRGTQILRGFDDDLRSGLAEEMGKRGVTILLGCEPTAIAKTAGGLRVTFSDGTTREAGAVMMATGRRPNTSRLGLEEAGVRMGKNGAVAVDAASRTSVPNIFAVGDVTDRINLTPVAIREGHAVADGLFGGKPWTVDHALIPTGVFSTPEIGTVGLTEAEAAAKATRGFDLYKARFRPMRNVLAGRDERTLMKLIVDTATQKVLGCHILGPDAAEIVQMAAIAMKMGATKADFDDTVALHPSAAEELVTMREKWVPPKTLAV